MLDNQQIYKTLEFDQWAYKEGLLAQERYLIETFLDKDAKTLEAGTAGGRILLAMKELGFTALYGYDYVSEFIDEAKQKDHDRCLSFEVQDATCLKYKDAEFDQIIYLQQIISLIEGETKRHEALKEAYRVLKPQGIALFSFLSFDSRNKDTLYLPYLTYLRCLRKLNHSNRSIQSLPWLKLGGKPNWNSLLDKEPYTYWYKLEEIDQLLTHINFEVIAIASDAQINQGKMYSSMEMIAKESLKGMLYVVCRK